MPEESGLIVPIDQWVLKPATSQAKSLSGKDAPLPRVDLNIAVFKLGW